ncbi:MAG: MmcQ/YjbR family DNA-binding protein [Planctomycetes bacterium]|nr:MmcQ/YjbR family DNA-binding protein [Planctomycetota bacterium]
MELHEAIAFALSLPEVREEPHFQIRSFRVGRGIFATAHPDEVHLHVFVDPGDVPAAVAADPRAIEPLHWGSGLAGVRILVELADPDRVRALLTAAWRRRAPQRTLRRFDADGPRPD